MSEKQSAFFQVGKSELGDDRSECLSRREEFGGKGAGLHALCACGYMVPPGFTLSSSFCRSYYDGGREMPAGLREELHDGLQRIEKVTGLQLGEGAGELRLAVRSGAAASMPGMMDTVLGLGTRDAVEEAVLRVFDSWSSERARTYRSERGIIGLEGTAVTVQALCQAEAAGVSFSRAPGTGGEDLVLIEAVEGLGEALVSGEVTPDSYLVAREGLELARERSRGDRLLGLEAIRELAGLTLRLEKEFGFIVDVEWAWAEGELWLLQVREAGAAAGGVDDLLAGELSRAGILPGGEGFLVRHNLDETLSCPTPMTWDIQSEFMSGRGGFGALYRELGYQPSGRVDSDGFLELVGGRVYADPQRCAELFYSEGILSYDRIELSSRPSAIEEPPRLWKTRDAGPPALLRTLGQLWHSAKIVTRGRQDALGSFLQQTLPLYEAWVAEKIAVELSELSETELFEELKDRIDRVMGSFAPAALKLSFYAGAALEELRDLLERCLGFQRGAVAVRELLSSLSGELAVDQAEGLLAAARSDSAMERFLDRFGHRSGGEMELAEKRWWEEPERVRALAEQMARGEETFLSRRGSLEERRDAVECEILELLSREQPEALESFKRLLAEARELLPWRENGKFYWMAGYDLVRRVLVELDDRLSLEGNIFYLERHELGECIAARRDGIPGRLKERIQERRDLRRRWRGLELPQVLSGERPVSQPGEQPADSASQDSLRGEGISSGKGRGRVWSCSSAAEKPPFEGPYLLVAESTDPDWTPLLAGASGLVVERGGSLSHGAIVCRDFGIPALVLEGACRKLETGVEAVVDADRGELLLIAEDEAAPGPGEEAAEAGEWEPGAEPFCSPSPPGSVVRVLGGLLIAVVVSLLLVSFEGPGALTADLAGLVLDRFSGAGSQPYKAIFWAALVASGCSFAILVRVSDRSMLKRLRQRLRWYREKIAEAKKNGRDRIRVRLAERMAAAKSDRVLVLMKPIAWTFLPLCIGFIWVNDRFAAEPISPGSRFTFTAFVDPSQPNAAGRLRYARLDAAEGLRVLGSSYRKLESNLANPAIAPYRVAWEVEALAAGAHGLSVTAAGEKVRKEILVSAGLDRAPAIGRYGGGLREVHVDHAPLLVGVPGQLHEGLSDAAAFFNGGRGLLPAPTAVGAWAAYLVLAVLAMLGLQGLTGYR
ncbi:MAG: PEP/pyruvate-binding domain-containing protein [Planctomycetota bacterium]|nr:PEP/pyruvate-binding domain-containing protein [Planctomycetota bacterium]